MSISIKLKIGIPVAILTIVIITLMAFGAFTLKKANQHSDELSSWFHENGEILAFNQSIAELLHPHVRLTMGQEFENNENTRQEIRQQRMRLEAKYEQLLEEENLTLTERHKLEILGTRILALSNISDRILTLRLPYEHDKGMQLIHELSINHIKPINQHLYEWYLKDLDQVDILEKQGKKESQIYFLVSIVLAILTLLALAMAVWINTKNILAPILKIKTLTAKLSKGDLSQRIEVSNNDEIGELAKDISEMARALETINQQLNEAARTDGLTNILNRRSCEEVLNQHFSSSIRYDMIFSIIMLDIDHFKQINDEHGHEAGDKALQIVAKICTDQIRDCDFAFRYGGEELLLLLPNTDKNDSVVVAERIRKTLRNTTIEFENTRIKLTASLGISSFPEDGLEQQELVRNADNALYRAKDRGRNQTVVFEKPLLL